MAEFLATVKAVLDDSELKKLDNISDKRVNVKVTLSGDVNQLDNVNESINDIRANARTPIQLSINSGDVRTELNLIEDQLRRIQNIHLNLGGNGRTRNTNREINRQYNNAMNLQRRMAKQWKSIEFFDTNRDTAQLNTYLAQYEGLEQRYNDIIRQFGGAFTDAQNERLGRVGEELEEQILQVKSKLQDSITKSLTDGVFDRKNSLLGQMFREIGNDSDFLRGQIDGVNDALDEMRVAAASGDIDGLLNAFNNFNHRYTSADNTFKVLKAERKEQEKASKAQQKAQNDALKAQQKATKLQNDKGILGQDIDLWSKKNLDLLDDTSNGFKSRLDDIRNAISTCNNEADLSNVKQQFQQLQKEAANFDFVNDIKKSAGFGEFDLQFDDLKKSLNQIREIKKPLNDAFSDLSNAKKAFDKTIQDSPNDIQKILENYKNYQDAVENFNAAYNKAKQVQDNEDYSKNLERQKTSLKNEIKTWLKENSAAAKEFGAQLNDIYSKIDNCNKAQLDGLENEFKDITSTAKAAGKATLSFGDKLKSGIAEEFTQLFSVSRLFDYGVDALRDMYDNVVAVDSAMINLKKVTDETDSTYNKFLDTSADTAIGLGRSMSSYIEQTADWTKLGYTLKEAEGLAKLSSVYANVAEIDDTTAVSDMVTAMKAFNIEVTNAAQITDALNELGNTFATDAGSLGQGLTKAAASMSNAGADLNQTLAMLTGGAEITQNATEFGNFLKTASMRIKGMKGELQELGEEVDPTVDSISKVQTQILNLTKNTSKPINIFDDSGNFRNYYTIMEEIASIYDEMTSTDRATLDEILFGKVRANQGAALIKAFQSGQIQKAYQTALNSEGSAAEEQEKWMEGLEAKMASFEAAWQHLSTSIMQSDLLGGLINFGTGAVELFADLVEGAGALNTALLGAGITGFLWNLD